MANKKFSQGWVKDYLKKAKQHGFDEKSVLYRRLKDRDYSASKELENIISDRYIDTISKANSLGLNKDSPIIREAISRDPNALRDLENTVGQVKNLMDQGIPKDDAIKRARQGRGEISSSDWALDYNRHPDEGKRPEGSFWTGTPSYRENIDNLMPNQRAYSDMLLNRATNEVPRSLDKLGELADKGFLDRLLFNGASEGFGNILQGLGDIDPSYIGGALGGLSNGGGIAGILSGLLGNALGSYGQKNFPTQSVMNTLGSARDNVSSGVGNLFKFFSGLN